MVVMPRVKEEMKTHDTDVGFTFNNNGTNAQVMVCVNLVPRDTSAITRIGKRILMKAFHVRGRIYPSSATVMDKCSLMLVYQRMGNDNALPNVNDILDTQIPNSLTKRDNASKFKILRRWDFSLIGSTTTPTNASQFIIDEYITFKKPLVVQWSQGNSSGAYTEIEKGALLLVGVGLHPVLSTTLVGNFDAKTRLYFHESDGYAY